MSARPRVVFEDLGMVAYAEAHAEQLRRAERVEAGEADGFLLLVEHPPVLTVGRRARTDELGLTIDEWRARGVDVVETDRGGRITYHGPGQVVLYPVLALRRFGLEVKAYVRALEQVGIDLLAAYGVAAGRDTEHTGVWVGERKVAAVGVHVRRWISTHGMAINVNTPLEVFDQFTPCGITGRGVASLSDLLGGDAVDMPQARRRVVECFAHVFDSRLDEP